MKSLRQFGLALLAFASAAPALADPPYRHHHPRTSVELGFYFGPPYYPYPYPYAYPHYWPPVVVPAPVIVQPAPVYVEQQPARVAATLEPGYWYYCAESKAYYPNVPTCPSPWQKIAPRPAQ